MLSLNAPRSFRTPAPVLAALVLLAGCATSRPAERAAPDGQGDSAEQASARIGLAATMEIPDNPYADSTALAEAMPLGGAPDTAAVADWQNGVAYGADEEGVSPDEVVVSRYYYDDEQTYYVDEASAPVETYDWDDRYYYGGYSSEYYRYADPAFFPSVYVYYRPYRTYRPYARYGWYGTWRSRARWRHATWRPAFNDCYHPYYYDPYACDSYYGYGPYVAVSVGWGPYGYGSGYWDGYRDGYYASGGYYGGHYGHGYGHRRWADEVRRGTIYEDDGERQPVRAVYPFGPVVQSTPPPERTPSRTGLGPARIPAAERNGTGPGGTAVAGPARLPTRTSDPDRAALPQRTDRGALPDRTEAPGRAIGPTRTTPVRMPDRTASEAPETTGRTAAPLPERTAPTRSAPSRSSDEARPTPSPTRRTEPARDDAPSARPVLPSRPSRERRQEESRPSPREESRPAPQPEPRRESRPAPRQESRPAPPPRSESRPAPAPRREESRPAPAPRQESRPSRSRDDGSSSRRPSRRGGND